LVPRRAHSPPFSRSIPTVLRPDQKQKETAPVLRVLKIKELLAQFLNRGGCASKEDPVPERRRRVVSKFQQEIIGIAQLRIYMCEDSGTLTFVYE
jgi:hypothetical protein